MFHSEFYPTPLSVLEVMGIDCANKVVLEPHAGKGDIVDYCKKIGAKNVLAFEINPDLQKIVKSKCDVLGSDFFTCKPEQISHINSIIMNPPFSNADRHIRHAFEIAPDGCEIIALCNYETIERENSHRQLSALIKNYGTTENLGDCFSTAERKTGVIVGLVRLFKPITKSDFNFDGFFTDESDNEIDGEGIMQYNEVRALVNRYVGVMKNFDRMKIEVDSVKALLSPINISGISLNLGYGETNIDKEKFSKIIQKRAWEYIFDKMEMKKYVTSGVMKDINKFVETQTKVPFTMKNIYRMFQIIVGTRSQTFDRALEEAIDNFTAHTHENRFGVEGWKTNSGYMLNKKFICEGIIDVGWGFKIKYASRNCERIDDLVKVLCNLTATPHNRLFELYNIGCEEVPDKSGKKWIQPIKDFQLTPNKWYDWTFFEVKFFKKGTMHVKFKDIETWYILNKAYGKLKGFSLPENVK